MGGKHPDQTPGDETPPKRIQLSRAKGWRMPRNAVKVDRSTPWGNRHREGDTHAPNGIPYHGGPLTRQEAINGCRADWGDRLNRDPDALEALRGKDLACWCRLDQPCHADVLLDLANRPRAGVSA